ncbi:hypothetical protein EG329_013734 [Mollisiaceae sp. DMI_Dod_QoI]|nr:hypothetical protein EG329_013734 [Helotiales sp. DMI_Dod_QoI]
MQLPALSPSSPSRGSSQASLSSASHSASLSPTHFDPSVHEPNSVGASPDAVRDWPFDVGSPDSQYPSSLQPYYTLSSTTGVDPFDPSFLANDGTGLLSNNCAAGYPFVHASNDGGFLPALVPAPALDHGYLPYASNFDTASFSTGEIQDSISFNDDLFSNPIGYPSQPTPNMFPNASVPMNQALPATFQASLSMTAMQPAPNIQANIQSVFRNQKHHCLWPAGCTKSFTRISDLERHWYSVHLGQKHHCTWFGCSDNQGKGFCRLEKLRKHQEDYHGFVLV